MGNTSLENPLPLLHWSLVIFSYLSFSSLEPEKPSSISNKHILKQFQFPLQRHSQSPRLNEWYSTYTLASVSSQFSRFVHSSRSLLIYKVASHLKLRLNALEWARAIYRTNFSVKLVRPTYASLPHHWKPPSCSTLLAAYHAQTETVVCTRLHGFGCSLEKPSAL